MHPEVPDTFHSGPCNPKLAPAHCYHQGQASTDAVPSAYPAHLVVVSEVTDPHVFIHIGVVEVLPEPADVTPVEIPLPFAGSGVGQRS